MAVISLKQFPFKKKKTQIPLSVDWASYYDLLMMVEMRQKLGMQHLSFGGLHNSTQTVGVETSFYVVIYNYSNIILLYDKNYPNVYSLA